MIDGRIAYGVNARGSGDMYPKGGNMLHTIRTVLNDDVRWRAILRGIQQTFGRRTSRGQEVRDYMSREAGIDLSRIFQQYLENPQLPQFQYRFAAGRLEYRWAEVVPGFDMPLDVNIPGMGTVRLSPTEAWQSLATTSPRATSLAVDENFYVTTRDVGSAGASGHQH
jgi:aminopeptidase N